MLAVFGLGNPEKKYERARHNAGFIVLDEIACELNVTWSREDKFKALIAKNGDLLLVKPQTYMNESGTCVRKITDYYKNELDTSNILIVHDDVDLPSGKTKLQFGSSSAGHHGIEDIIEKLGTKDFWRLRIGVGRPDNGKYNVMDWVLSDLSDEELDFVKRIRIEDGLGFYNYK